MIRIAGVIVPLPDQGFWLGSWAMMIGRYQRLHAVGGFRGVREGP